MTHPFHPLYGRDFEFVAYRQNWGEDRVHLHDENGQLFSLPAAWTDAVAADLRVPKTCATWAKALQSAVERSVCAGPVLARPEVG